MATLVIQLADGAFSFLAGVRLLASAAARKLSLIALVPTRIAVRVIVFNTLWNDRLQTDFRIRLAIRYSSSWFDLSADYRAKPLPSQSAAEHLRGQFAMGASAPIASATLPILTFAGAGSQFQHLHPNRFHSQEFSMNKDQAKGRIEEAKGKVKEVTGNLVGNDNLALKGTIQKSGGKAQAAYGDLKKDIKDASKGK